MSQETSTKHQNKKQNKKQVQLINIRDVDDPFERYKMPVVELRQKHQGKYNSTYVLNICAIAKALKTETTYIVKWMGATLGVQATLTNNEELQLKGLINKEEILTLIRSYIDVYVLCKSCTLPEVDYTAGSRSLRVRCRSCGYRGKCDQSDRIYKMMYQKQLMSQTHNSTTSLDVRDEMEQQVNEMKLAEGEESENENWSVCVTEEALEKRRIQAIGDSKVMNKLLQ